MFIYNLYSVHYSIRTDSKFYEFEKNKKRFGTPRGYLYTIIEEISQMTTR